GHSGTASPSHPPGIRARPANTAFLSYGRQAFGYPHSVVSEYCAHRATAVPEFERCRHRAYGVALYATGAGPGTGDWMVGRLDHSDEDRCARWPPEADGNESAPRIESLVPYRMRGQRTAAMVAIGARRGPRRDTALPGRCHVA